MSSISSKLLLLYHSVPVLMGGKKAWCLSFNGTSSTANCGSNLDDLHDAEFTVDLWIKSTATTYTRMIIDKGILGGKGWGIYLASNGEAKFVVCGTNTPDAATANGSISDGNWHHLAAYFNDAGDRKPYIALDGIWRPAGGAVSDAIASDAANNLVIGATSALNAWYWQGYIGWVRLSNNDRFSHGTNFTRPSRTTPPASDANTLELWQVIQSTGNAIASVTTPGNDAALTNVTWVKL